MGQFLSAARGLLLGRLSPILVDYQITARPRYGWGKPMHPELASLLERGRSQYAELFRSFAAFHVELSSIPVDAVDGKAPAWRNEWFNGLDPLALYALLRLEAPSLYIEVGSGHSTRFARRSIQDGGSSTRLTSIDPNPRVEIDSLCDEVIRSRLEDVDLTIFNRLADGDVLFLDGSHRVFTNSDVAVAFLEVLPRLAAGVLIHVHDIWWPADYPPALDHAYYSEQYLLACLLLGNPSRYQVVLPNAFVSLDPRLSSLATEAFAGKAPVDWSPEGTSFWFRVVGEEPAAS